MIAAGVSQPAFFASRCFYCSFFFEINPVQPNVISALCAAKPQGLLPK
jgi:hypothetical protein